MKDGLTSQTLQDKGSKFNMIYFTKQKEYIQLKHYHIHDKCLP